MIIYTLSSSSRSWNVLSSFESQRSYRFQNQGPTYPRCVRVHVHTQIRAHTNTYTHIPLSWKNVCYSKSGHSKEKMKRKKRKEKGKEDDADSWASTTDLV